ncbi:hypothetical protein WL27_02165 [Burkholderia multivorans]|nr:hypothetical protein WL27_02165 [Burkholderia multivorans]
MAVLPGFLWLAEFFSMGGDYRPDAIALPIQQARPSDDEAGKLIIAAIEISHGDAEHVGQFHHEPIGRLVDATFVATHAGACRPFVQTNQHT